MDELGVVAIALFLMFNVWYWIWRGLRYLWDMDSVRWPQWRPTNPLVAYLAFIVGGIGFSVGIWGQDWFDNRYWAFVADLAPELVGMAFTVFVIDELVERVAAQRLRRQLEKQLRSPVRDIAVEALRLAREDEWFDELDKSDMQMVQWAGALLHGVDMSGSNLTIANLEQANLFDADLENADLRAANLTQAILIRANLRGSNLERAALVKANLQQSDLAEANLTGTNLEEAQYDDATIWPFGFDPDEAGAVKVAQVHSTKYYSL